MTKNLLLWVGEQRNPVKKDRKSDLVMDSVINYYDDDHPQLSYSPGQLFLDSGAFTASMKGLALSVEKVVSVQEFLSPNKAIPLDYPFRTGMPISQMKRRWQKTASNIIYWQESTRLKGKLVPTLHAWDKRSLRRNVIWLQKKADADYVALGSLVDPNFTRYGGFFGDRQPQRELVDMLSLAIKSVQEYTDFKVHLMGFGSSPLMLHLGYYLGANSTDSSGYRRKAAFGKIILPGTGERYVGNTSASFGIHRPLFETTIEYDWRSSADISLLQRCSCPICQVNKDSLWVDWKSRAIHNEYVMKEEAKLARALLSAGTEAYESYLDNVVFAHSSLKYLWDYAKLRKKYLRISDVLF